MSAREHVAVWRAPAPPGVCVIVRSVAEASDGAPVEACVQANPYACLNVVVRGRVWADGQALPSRFLCGPLTSPLATSVREPMLSASLVVHAWALPVLVGEPASPWIDRLAGPDAWPDGPLAPLAERAEALALGRAAPEDLWSALPAVPPPGLAFDVLLRDGVVASAQASGHSERHYRRRFQGATGLTPAVWSRLVRWERAAPRLLAGDGGLAVIAAAAGYADQAHLTRETRAFVRQTPAALRRAAGQGREQWSLVPAHGRKLQDAD